MRRQPSAQPLVSILIPAYNAGEFLAATVQSALNQTWPSKEIIIVDDGSRDDTLAVAKQFESKLVKVVSQENQGAAAARNRAMATAQGEFLQWLDADDLLSSEKVERQIEAARQEDAAALFSSPWAYFKYRPSKAKFVPTALWEDLSPLEWMTRKMEQNLHMQTATWLVSRELAEKAGPWNPELLVDDDGEYFARVVMHSEKIKFVDRVGVYYRVTPSGRVSYIGRNSGKIQAQLRSMELHIRYIQSLGDSPRIRAACVAYIQTWLPTFYPERQDLVDRACRMAEGLGGKLTTPSLSWKYAWIQKAFGWPAAKLSQIYYNRLKTSLSRLWDKVLFRFAGGGVMGIRRKLLPIDRNSSS
jgi:glycosyltransferase involved in cell wall biosynthesis